MADLTSDPEFVELCRAAAWAGQPRLYRFWNVAEGKFNWPEGWPDGVEPESFVRSYVRTPSSTQAAGAPHSESVTPSVRRLRELLK